LEAVLKTTQAQRATKKQIKHKKLTEVSNNQIDSKNGQATEEQKTYSGILSAGRKLGLASIGIALIAYLSGLMNARVPMSILPRYWGMSAADYMKATGLKGGWAWLNLYQYGDMLSFFGIAILGMVSVACYLAIIPTLARKKDYPYFIIAIFEVLVLISAASGLVNFGE
jgi:hypothetical protein